ncbi:MAG: 30S ribosomal protein S15 [Candidatus Kapaibacterium sp.]
MVSKERKAELIAQYGGSTTNTGSPEAQVAILTEHINLLQSHLDTHKKDLASRRGLIRLVNKRRTLLNFLQSRDIKRYRAIIASLSLRK